MKFDANGLIPVIVRDAPAAVCQNCGEYSLDKATTGKLYRQGVETVR